MIRSSEGCRALITEERPGRGMPLINVGLEHILEAESHWAESAGKVALQDHKLEYLSQFANIVSKLLAFYHYLISFIFVVSHVLVEVSLQCEALVTFAALERLFTTVLHHVGHEI